jgi:hypothetical protein
MLDLSRCQRVLAFLICLCLGGLLLLSCQQMGGCDPRSLARSRGLDPKTYILPVNCEINRLLQAAAAVAASHAVQVIIQTDDSVHQLMSGWQPGQCDEAAEMQALLYYTRLVRDMSCPALLMVSADSC